MSILIKNIILDGQNQDIYIEKEIIKEIGKSLDYAVEEKIDGRGEKAVLPGLINSHTHSAMTLFRGYGDGLPLQEWLEKRIWPAEAKLTEDDVYWGTKLACLEMIKTGTTCFNDMYWHEKAAMRAIKEMGLRAVIGMVVLDFDAKGKKERIENLYKELLSIKPDFIKLALAPHAIYTVSKENLIWAKDFARENNLLLHIHLSETEKEVQDCLEKYGLRPVEFLEKIGFLGENVIFAHAVYLSDEEIKILSERKCSVINCPCSNAKIAVGEIFPYARLSKAGVNVTLATDGAASNNNLDMFEEMKFASLLQKHKDKDATAAGAEEVFSWATKNGAKALGVDAGEIKEGKLADLILIDLTQTFFSPGHNFISDVVYSGSGSAVTDLICNGKILMRDQKVEGEREITERATTIARELTER